MAGMKVYDTPTSANTIRALAALNEKGADYELVPIDLRTGAHKQPHFCALNPFGQIPVLEDRDNVLSESRASNRHRLQVRGEQAELLRSSGTLAERVMVDLWLEVESQQFGPLIYTLVFEVLVKPMKGGATKLEVVEAQSAKLDKVLDVYEERLGQSKYLAGEHYTLADLNCRPYLFYLMQTPKAELVTSRSHVLAWWQDVSARPAWLKTIADVTT